VGQGKLFEEQMASSQRDWPLGIEPGQEVEIDLFRPQDAPGVAALFGVVYGADYPIKVYYDPELLARENATGKIVSMVARTPRGEVVGHIALFNSSPNPRQFELGAGGVLPTYRNTSKLLTRMMTHGPRVAAQRFGLQAVFGDPVCTHVYSQKICQGLGWITHALEVDLMPADLYGQASGGDDRVSALMAFITLVPKPHEVYLPAVYEKTLRYLYQDLDDVRQIRTSEQAVPKGLATRLESKVYQFSQLARLTVWEVGADLAEALAREEESVLGQGVQVIQVWLQLSCPWVGRAVELLRQRGYFLGGLLPRWFDWDGLLMQRLVRQPHWDSINLEYDRAKTLLSLVRQDWREVTTGR
jgi:hypothetical protein